MAECVSPDQELISSSEVDMSVTDSDCNTALHLACIQKQEGCALKILEKAEVTVLNVANKDGKTPLHIAANNGLVSVVQELITKGASLLAVDNKGYTPALSCAPNDKVADCLAIILAHMIPLSPENFTSKSRIALALTGELRRSRTSNSLDLTDGNRSRADSAADTSDSETY